MLYAINNDKTGFRVIPSEEFLIEGEALSTTLPEVSVDIKTSALNELYNSSITVERIIEGIALGTCNWDNQDVIDFMNYRKVLRNIVNGTDKTHKALPRKPLYPAGT